MDQYHQILCLTLKETGKNKVLEAVKALEARPDVLSAEPDYLVAVEENPDDSYYSSEQWGPQKSISLMHGTMLREPVRFVWVFCTQSVIIPG